MNLKLTEGDESIWTQRTSTEAAFVGFFTSFPPMKRKRRRFYISRNVGKVV